MHEILEPTSIKPKNLLFADVILPIPIPQLFTYKIPLELQAGTKLGSRVIVQFGKRKVLTAIVAKIHSTPPQKYQAKDILELLDDVPMVTPYQLQLFEWMADYYMCNIGEVMNVALPSGLKISTLSKIQLRPEIDVTHIALSDTEQKLIKALHETQSLSYDEASGLLDVKNIYRIIKSLIEKEVILVFEEVRERYQPKTIKKIRLTADYITRSELDRLAKNIENKPKQSDILLFYLRHVPVFKDWTLNERGMDKSLFTQNDNLSESALKTMLKNGVFDEFETIVSRFEEYQGNINAEVNLSATQTQASNQILEYFEKQSVVLLHGITGSGKTEIYIDLIQKVLAGGSQVLYLLPEIAITTQIVARLKKIFGSQMGVYHSKFSDNERVEVWQGVITGKFNFVVAVRSGIFLPFNNLGLIIVDEEHETSYKQQDPAPRYNARDMALVIAVQQHCKVLLGSATPAVESFYHAKTGKYALVQIKERFGDAQLPEIMLADQKAERKAKTMKGIFTSILLGKMEERLQNKEQIILFQNRRGYSPYMTCKDCAWIPDCKSCDVSLTYHLQEKELRCHYCGYTELPPRKCPQCGSTRIETVGLGTEKIEDEIKMLLPETIVQRMDLDTTRAKNSYQKILEDFENRQIDILVGTQMISKGLDFDNVSLVGIFDVDRILNFPDFRAHERAFQILTQVSGRAGRSKDKKGQVVIQTSNTQQEILWKVIRNDYEGLYLSEIEDRAYFFYPPFTRIIKITTKNENQELSKEAAQLLTDKLVAKLGKARVLGPEPPLINRIRNKFLFNILIKVEREKVDLKALKKFIREQVEDVITTQEYRKVDMVVDVDPI
jgi:primosomal protein N' (replication factor Y) (superfamily II helicase)